MSFAIAIFIVALSCSAITIKTLVGYSNFSFFIKLIVSALVLMSWFAPVILRIASKNLVFDGAVYRAFFTIGYFCFGLAFIIFSLLILRDLGWYIIYGIGKISGHLSEWMNPRNVDILNKSNFVVLVASLFLAFHAFFAAVRIPPIKEITFATPKLKQDIKIVHLTDLHFSRATPLDRVKKIVERVNNLNPDVIIITGDVVDDSVPALSAYMDELEKLKAKNGVFVSSGNHELYSGIHSWSKKFKDMGFYFLFNQGKSVPELNLFIGGIPDMNTANSGASLKIDMPRTFSNSKEDEYKVLMSHYPQVFDFKGDVQYDLQLSGHTHGGQIFPFHLLAKKANHYLAGKYSKNGVDLYVSRGAGYWGPPMRLLAPSEITLIKLKAE